MGQRQSGDCRQNSDDVSEAAAVKIQRRLVSHETMFGLLSGGHWSKSACACTFKKVKSDVCARWRRAFLESEREHFELLVQAFSSGNLCLFAPGPVLGLTIVSFDDQRPLILAGVCN